MIYFSIDNANLKTDTPGGKNQLQSTVIVAYQKESKNKQTKKQTSDLFSTRNQKREAKRGKDPIYKVTYCQHSNRTDTKCKNYTSLSSPDLVKPSPI